MRKLTFSILAALFLVLSNVHAEQTNTAYSENTGVTASGVYYTTIANTKTDKAWLLMVHGFTHDQRYYERQLAYFSKSYNLLLIDYRGHGKSEAKQGPYGFEEYADDALEVVDHMAIQRLHYWGSHTGATVGLIITLRRPQLISSLILEGGFANDFPMPDVSETFSRAVKIARSTGPEEAIENWFNTGAWFDHIRQSNDPQSIQQHREIVVNFQGAPWLSKLQPRQKVPMTNKLKTIEQPAILITGEFDSREFIDASINLNERLANSVTRTIVNAGGFAAWERPQEVNQLVAAFLEDVG